MAHPLKIVIAGCGGISELWFNALAKRPDLSIVGIVDLFEASALRRRDQFQLSKTRVGIDVAAMLAETQPDILFDCTIPDARPSVVLEGLKHGCHVLAEKPMAPSMAEARQLIEVSAQAGKLYAIMQNRRYDPRIRSLRAFCDSGAVGLLTTVDCDFQLGAHFGGFRDKMKHVLLLDMAIHSFDQARLISGCDPVSVYCHEWNPPGSWYEHGAAAVAIFEMSNGVVCTYRGSWCAEGLPTTWECDWRLTGVNGSVRWDGADNFRAQVVDKDEGFIRPYRDVAVPLVEPAQATGHAACIYDFIECVQTGRIPETVCTENIKSLSMVFGAIESAESGQRISLA